MTKDKDKIEYTMSIFCEGVNILLIINSFVDLSVMILYLRRNTPPPNRNQAENNKVKLDEIINTGTASRKVVKLSRPWERHGML